MSITYAGMSPVSGCEIFPKAHHVVTSDCVYRRLADLVTQERWLPYEQSMNGRLKRALDTLRKEVPKLPKELAQLHKIVSDTVHVILLGDGTKVDYNAFLNDHTWWYPPHEVRIPKKDDSLHKLSELMGVTGLYTGYAKLIQKIIW